MQDLRVQSCTQGFPTTGQPAVAAWAFHGGMASILGLYAQFWLRLTLVTTLVLMLPLGTFTVVAGIFALRAQAAARLKASGLKKE